MKKVIALQSPHEKQVICNRSLAEKNNWLITYNVEVRPEHDKKPGTENVNKVPQAGTLLNGFGGHVYKILTLTPVEVCCLCGRMGKNRIYKKFYCDTHYNNLVITKPIVRTIAKPNRNQPCACGSGKKYKYCCLSKDQHTARHYYNSEYRQNQQSQKTA